MIDLYLKAESKQALIEALPFARRKDEDDNEFWVTDTHDYSLVVIGKLYSKDGVYGENGEVITAPTEIEGFHANIRCKQNISKLIPKDLIIDKPQNPKRVWF